MTAGRRKYLQALGIATLGGIAGCSSDNSQTTPAENTNANTDTLSPETGQQTSTITPTRTLTPTVQPTASPESIDQTQSKKLLPHDGDKKDTFGSGLAVSEDGNTVFIAAPSDLPNGSVYVFSREGGAWDEKVKFRPNEGESYNNFGNLIELSTNGTTALVYGGVGDPGGAYVFSSEGGTWGQQAKLSPGEVYGSTIELSGDGTTALVTNTSDGTNGEYSGATYVFSQEGETWNRQAKLVADDLSRGDNFGYQAELSEDGDTALIAGGDSVYMFSREGGTWTQQADVAGDGWPAGQGMAEFSEDGTTVLMSDPKWNSDRPGVVYVISREGTELTQEATLLADDGDSADSFGFVDLSRDGTLALIGASRDDDPNGEDAGSAYLFKRGKSSWTQQAKLVPDDGKKHDMFGGRVAVSGDGTTAIVSSPIANEPNGLKSGAAYVFDL